MASDSGQPQTGGEALLRALKESGIDYLFANAGTDFPPIIEGFARLSASDAPTPVTVPFEGAGVAMAHGYWLVSGRAQAVMVHVNVGLANAVMGVINAASDDVPVLMMSGRTPLTETGREGHRASQIQYGQEMYDQASLVRDVAKFTYEIRYPEQCDSVIKRAAALMNAAPCGPVYVSLPKEPLADTVPAGTTPAPVLPQPTPAQPDPQAIATLDGWIRAARRPVILCQRGDTEGTLAALLSDLGARYGLGVIEPYSIRNLLASDDPALLGYAPGLVRDADLVIVLDTAVPWVEALTPPDATARVVHIGHDPHFRRMPVRGYRSDLSIAADPVAAMQALLAHAPDPQARPPRQMPDIDEAGQGEPMSPAWMSRCISQIMDKSAVAFTELGLMIGQMAVQGPNRVFGNVHAGGLGWAFPAALGAQLADRDRLVIACMGDGSYMFANPVACHQIAEALDLAPLIIVKNNRQWNAVRRSVLAAYPQGAAAQMNRMPLTSLDPVPDFAQVARASRAHAERVTRGSDLPDALRRAVRVIREERRAVLLDLDVAATETF